MPVQVWLCDADTLEQATTLKKTPPFLRQVHLCQAFLFTAGHKAKQDLKTLVDKIKIKFWIKATWKAKKKERSACEESLKTIEPFRMNCWEIIEGYKIVRRNEKVKRNWLLLAFSSARIRGSQIKSACGMSTELWNALLQESVDAYSHHDSQSRFTYNS